MDYLNSLRLGPGLYEAKKVRDDTCLTDYKKQMEVTKPRINLDRMDRDGIGPGYYYAKDDLVKPAVLGFKIVLPKEDPLKEFDEIDRRLPLDLNFDQVDKRVAGGLINPKPEGVNPNKYLEELENNRVVD